MAEGMRADIELPGEVSVELSPDQLLIRSVSIFHASWQNQTEEGRLMHHWLYRPQISGNHRFRWEEYLTPQLLERLTDAQRAVLLVDKIGSFEIDPVYRAEREKEKGIVHWGTREQLQHGWHPAL